MEEDWKKAYQKELLQFYHHPLGTGPVPEGAFSGWARNRTCGDEVTLSLQVEDGIIKAVWQETRGCAIATAAASLLVKTLPGRDRREVDSLLPSVLEMVREGKCENVLGELQPLRAVHPLSSRHECVAVAVRACEKALAASTSTGNPAGHGVR